MNYASLFQYFNILNGLSLPKLRLSYHSIAAIHSRKSIQNPQSQTTSITQSVIHGEETLPLGNRDFPRTRTVINYQIQHMCHYSQILLHNIYISTLAEQNYKNITHSTSHQKHHNKSALGRRSSSWARSPKQGENANLIEDSKSDAHQ